MGLFKIKNNSRRAIEMDYGLAYGDEPQGVRERENSEWGGKTSGVSAMGFFPAGSWGDDLGGGEISK